MLKVFNLTVGYKSPLLANLNFEVKQGEKILLCGANGSGKTTLLKTLSGNIPPLEGKVTCDGKHTFLPSTIAKVNGFTVNEFIEISLYDKGLSFTESKSKKKEIDYAIDLLELQDIRDRDISTISDGEFQKACIASAIASGNKTISMDEPMAFLDIQNRELILRTIDKLSKKNHTIIFSSHNITEAVRFCDRVIGISQNGELLVSETLEEDKIKTIRTCFPKIISILVG